MGACLIQCVNVVVRCFDDYININNSVTFFESGYILTVFIISIFFNDPIYF